MKTKILSLLLCVGMLFACNNTQKGAAIGAGGGAVLGGIIGHIAGNTAIGAAIGGAVGAGAGAIIGNRMDKAKKAAQSFDAGILFATGKADLSAASQTSISEIAKVLKENSDMDIAIIGHTDSTGSDAVNNPLSVNRAKSVQNSLKNQGVNNIKRVEGQGSKNPVADNSTESGRKLNRRVEVYMYASKQMIDNAKAQAN